MEENDVPEIKVQPAGQKDYFILSTSLLSLVISGLYVARILTEGPNWRIIFLAAANLIYVPYIMFFKKKYFSYFFLAYSTAVVFILAFTQGKLYNNYSGLFLACIVIMLNPKLKNATLTAYSVAACTAFLLNDEDIIHFLLHVTRGAWFIFVLDYIFKSKYDKKPLILYEDEKEILDQLANGAIYQKEVQGFSENTVYRKLKAARERNGNVTRDQLVELYIKSKQQ